MKTSSSFLFAFRLLIPKHRTPSNARKSMLGAVLCVALSLIPLVVVLVVADGMIEGITDRIVGLSSYHIQIEHRSTRIQPNSALDDLKILSQTMRSVEGVRSANAEVQGIALGSGKTGRTGVTVRAVEPSVFSTNKAFTTYFSLIEGSLSLERDKSALIGENIAKNLGLSIGDTLYLISSSTSSSGSVIPKLTNFKVAGIISSGYRELDALWVFIPLDNAFDVFSSANSQLLVGLEVTSPFTDEIYEVYNAVDDALPPADTSYMWNELNTAQFENYASTKMLLLLVMLLIVLVASVNVSSALVMLVMERRKEIAILKSVGASGSGISLSFLIIGTCIGGLGVVIGIPLGLVCAVNVNEIILLFEKIVNFFIHFVYSIIEREGFTAIQVLDPEFYLEKVPVTVPFIELFLIASLTMCLSLAVSLFPAIRAGKEKPLTILRKV